MDTRQILHVDDESIRTKPSKLEESERAILHKYVITFQELDELFQLFDVYDINLKLLHSICNLQINGGFECKAGWSGDDFTTINILTTNIISSGKVFTEALDRATKAICGVDSIEREHFRKNAYSSEYSKELPYFILSNFRDIVQHGHLVVSLDDSSEQKHFCFDIEQIRGTLHFSFKKPFADKMENISKEIEKRFNSSPVLSYTSIMSGYSLSVVRIHNCFLKTMCPVLNDIDSELRLLLVRRKDIAQFIEERGISFVVYEAEGRLWAFSPDTPRLEEFSKKASRCKERLKNLEAEHLRMHFEN